MTVHFWHNQRIDTIAFLFFKFDENCYYKCGHIICLHWIQIGTYVFVTKLKKTEGHVDSSRFFKFACFIKGSVQKVKKSHEFVITYASVRTGLLWNTLQIISTEPKLKGSSHKRFVSPNILEVHDSKIRIDSKKKKKRNQEIENPMNHSILNFDAREETEFNTYTWQNSYSFVKEINFLV